MEKLFGMMAFGPHGSWVKMHKLATGVNMPRPIIDFFNEMDHKTFEKGSTSEC